jgi:hypothetical protein
MEGDIMLEAYKFVHVIYMYICGYMVICECLCMCIWYWCVHIRIDMDMHVHIHALTFCTYICLHTCCKLTMYECIRLHIFCSLTL